MLGRRDGCARPSLSRACVAPRFQSHGSIGTFLRMLGSSERFLTTHAGSLPRPAPLVSTYAEAAAAQRQVLQDPALQARVEHATAECIRRQLDARVDVGNDGEQGRESFVTYVRGRLSGYSGSWQRPVMRDITAHASFLAWRMGASAGTQVSLLYTPVAQDEVRYLGSAAVDAECERLLRLAKDQGQQRGSSFAECFLTAASPGIIAAAMPSHVHASYDEYVGALAEQLRGEYRSIVSHGLVLQLDCPDLAMERHTSFADRPLADFLAFVDSNIAAINRAIEGIAPSSVRLHVCWGNYEGPHDLDVPLEAIIERIYGANVGALVLSMANPRHAHEASVLKRYPLPPHMLLVAGVIDTTTNYVEHPEVVAERIEKAASAVGDPRRVIAGTDCGFDTAAGMRDVAEDIVWLKLAALADGAELATQRLLR